jgi:hypothetical protein
MVCHGQCPHDLGEPKKRHQIFNGLFLLRTICRKFNGVSPPRKEFSYVLLQVSPSTNPVRFLVNMTTNKKIFFGWMTINRKDMK